MTIKSHERILMTGAAGNLGKQMRTRLKANCSQLRLSDRLAFDGDAQAGEEIMLADLADAQAVMRLVEGVDAIVHFGGVSVEGPFNPILNANIIGIVNLYEAEEPGVYETDCRHQHRGEHHLDDGHVLEVEDCRKFATAGETGAFEHEAKQDTDNEGRRKGLAGAKCVERVERANHSIASLPDRHIHIRRRTRRSGRRSCRS